jgi:hypothetical protein
MKALAAAIGSAVAERWALWAAIATGFVVVYNVMLLAAVHIFHKYVKPFLVMSKNISQIFLF